MTVTLTISAAFLGRKYMGFIGPYLEALTSAYPSSELPPIFLAYDALPAHMLAAYKETYPGVSFVHADAGLRGTREQRVSRKLRAWFALACAAETASTTHLALTDGDALVRRPFADVVDADSDIVVTVKEPPFPLNSGVVILARHRAREFVAEWLRTTEAICDSPEALRSAVRASGGADQESLRMLVGDGDQKREERSVGGSRFLVQRVPCNVLNEVRSVPLTAETRVIHYKAGWHPILLGTASFTDARPADLSQDMHTFWQDCRRRSGLRMIGKKQERPDVETMGARLGVDMIWAVPPATIAPRQRYRPGTQPAIVRTQSRVRFACASALLRPARATRSLAGVEPLRLALVMSPRAWKEKRIRVPYGTEIVFAFVMEESGCGQFHFSLPRLTRRRQPVWSRVASVMYGAARATADNGPLWVIRSLRARRGANRYAPGPAPT